MLAELESAVIGFIGSPVGSAITSIVLGLVLTYCHWRMYREGRD